MVSLPSVCLSFLTDAHRGWDQSQRCLPGLSPLSSAYRWVVSRPSQVPFCSQIETKPSFSSVFGDVSCGKGINYAQAKGEKGRKERDDEEIPVP